MKNAEYVQIYYVCVGSLEYAIPHHIIQDGPNSNIEEFDLKIRFSRVKDVRISYVLNSKFQDLCDIRLDSLKEVSRL